MPFALSSFFSAFASAFLKVRHRWFACLAQAGTGPVGVVGVVAVVGAVPTTPPTSAELLPSLPLSPQDAMHALVRNDVELLPVEQIAGRIAATLALVYPPGIGVVVPGERYDEHAKPMLDYFRMFEEAGNRFPGFENEIQGIYRKTGSDGRTRLYTYVVTE